jgi:hypothetical protein
VSFVIKKSGFPSPRIPLLSFSQWPPCALKCPLYNFFSVSAY